MKKQIAWFKTLSPIMQIVVGLLVLLALWWAFNYIKSTFVAIGDRTVHKSEVAVLTASGVQASFTETQYQSMATQLYTAMDSSWYNPFSYGTDEETIEDVFGRLKNDMDFMRLQSAFGIKDGYGLIEWLDGDLSADEKQRINTMMSSKDITKQI